MNDNIPIYNLKAVMHEVGLSAATLRAWELRYGLPKPQRTAGGHRLYSKQDIEMLKWLVEKQNEGLSISHAVELWKTLNLENRNLKLQIQLPVAERGRGEVMLDELREQWISACLAFSDHTANQVLDQAFAIAAPETVCTEVLQRGLVQIGQLWYAGNIRVQQEHFASAIAIRRINSLLAATIPPIRPGIILAACPPGEQHDFILLLATYLLRRGGWDVVYLGSNVPLKDLDLTIQSTTPLLVISAAQTLNSAASLRILSEYINHLGIPLAYGGRIFTSIPLINRTITGYYLGSEVANISQLVERLLIEQPSMPMAQPVSQEYSRTREKFLQNKPAIMSFVNAGLQEESVEPSMVELANENLSQNISSALGLGEISFLDSSVSWLNGMLNNHGVSSVSILKFFSVYQQALEHYLGDDGVIILNWLGRYLTELGVQKN
jgi:MerR family transcriptional regulator, light-induced transcriptional regulator